jgi:hypothetical protein
MRIFRLLHEWISSEDFDGINIRRVLQAPAWVRGSAP